MLAPIAIALAAVLAHAPAPVLTAAHSGTAPRPTTHSSEVPPLAHVLVVILENHSYNEVRELPFAASLIARGASFANSFAIAHPSQPNYLALWAGSTMDVANDSCPSPGSPYDAENLGHACEAAGLRWRSYAEDLPHVASDTCRAAGKRYTRKHDPWTNFSNLHHDNERPFGDLAADIANDSLPNLAFVIPNNCHNSHDKDCSAQVADSWIADNLPAMLTAVGPRGIVILTWDEDDGRANNRILTVFSGALVDSNVVSDRVISHFSIVNTICTALGLPVFANALTDSAITDVWRSDPLAPVALVRAPTSVVPTPALSAAYLDPASRHVFVAVQIPKRAKFSATVMDTSGRLVREISRGERQGKIALEWDGRDASGTPVPPGTYVLRNAIGETTLEQRIVLSH